MSDSAVLIERVRKQLNAVTLAEYNAAPGWLEDGEEALAALAELEELLGAALDREAGTSDALDAGRKRTEVAERGRQEALAYAEKCVTEAGAAEAQVRKLVKALEAICEVGERQDVQIARDALAKVRG
jgi:hypothetical protein